MRAWSTKHISKLGQSRRRKANLVNCSRLLLLVFTNLQQGPKIRKLIRHVYISMVHLAVQDVEQPQLEGSTADSAILPPTPHISIIASRLHTKILHATQPHARPFTNTPTRTQRAKLTPRQDIKMTATCEKGDRIPVFKQPDQGIDFSSIKTA